MVVGSSPVPVTWISDFAAASSKDFLDIQATIERGFTLKRVRNMTRRYSHSFYPSQHFNFGSVLLQHCNNVDLALKTKQNSHWIFSVAQRWYNVGVRRWNNIDTAVFQRCAKLFQNWQEIFSTLFQQGLRIRSITWKPIWLVIRIDLQIDWSVFF